MVVRPFPLSFVERLLAYKVFFRWNFREFILYVFSSSVSSFVIKICPLSLTFELRGRALKFGHVGYLPIQQQRVSWNGRK